MYTKTLNRLTWLNTGLDVIRIASGISSVATLATLIGFPVGIPLSGTSRTGVSLSCMSTTLTNKYQKNLLRSRSWMTS